MKNLENSGKLDNLPFKASRKEYITEKYGDMWNIHKFDHPWERSDKTKSPWFILDNVIKKFKRDTYDNAFSYYCKLVPYYEQRRFHEYFYPYLHPKYGKDFILVNNIITENGNAWSKRRKHNKKEKRSSKQYYENLSAKRKKERENIQSKNSKKYCMLTDKELSKKYKLPFDKTSLWLCRHVLTELRK